jgi:hypothetical protein
VDSAEHFGEQAEVQWYYSAFGIVHGDVFKTEHELLDATAVSLKEGCSRRVSFSTLVTKY